MGSLSELLGDLKALQPTVKLPGTVELLKYIIDTVLEPMA